MDHMFLSSVDLIRSNDRITKCLKIIVIITIFNHLTTIATTVIFDRMRNSNDNFQTDNYSPPPTNYNSRNITCNYCANNGHEITDYYTKKKKAE